MRLHRFSPSTGIEKTSDPDNYRAAKLRVGAAQIPAVPGTTRPCPLTGPINWRVNPIAVSGVEYGPDQGPPHAARRPRRVGHRRAGFERRSASEAKIDEALRRLVNAPISPLRRFSESHKRRRLAALDR